MAKTSINQISFGISGAPGVGKTTIVNEVVKRVSGRYHVEVSRDVARVLASRGVRINTECQAEDYLAFTTMRLWDMLRLRGYLVIYDRTLLDVLIFMELNGNAGGWLKEVTTEFVKWQMTQLSLYFYVPIEFEVKPDGLRVADPSVNCRIDRITHRLLQEYQSNFITLKGSLSERVGMVLESLSYLGLDTGGELG
jgi:predicted ATPase